MTFNVEKLEQGAVKITITVPAADFEKAVTASYQKNKGKYEIPGFRKGKAPQAMLEKTYGDSLFFEDAFNDAVDTAYTEFMDKTDLDIVSRPEIEIVDAGKGKDFVFTATVAVRPEVKLGEYKNIKVKKAPTEVTDEEVDEQIKQEQNRNARLVEVADRAAKLSDTVRIDFDGSVDGEHFEGGKGTDYPLELGSHSFIDTFEDQIVGHKVGDEFDVNVTFPKEYGAPHLAGKAATFAVKVNEIKEKQLPELDDEFASEVSEFDTFAEYKEDVKKKLNEALAKRAKTEDENNLVDKIVENATVELPELMVKTRVASMAEDYARRMMSQGLNFEDYLRYTNTTLDQFKEQIKPDAEKELKASLILDAVANAENIEVTEEDTDNEIKKMAVAYQMPFEDLKSRFSDDDMTVIKDNVRIQNAINWLVENADFE